MELTFKLLKNQKQEIVGFSLVAGGETYSEMFVESLGKAIHDKGTAVLKVETDTITFLDSTTPYTVKIGEKDAEALKSLLANPKELGLYREPYYLGTGLRVVLTEYKDLVAV